MRIKSADDKTKRLNLLQDLSQSKLLDAWQKKQITNALSGLKKGIQGERDAAHYLDNHYRDSNTHALIHDLRLSVDGEVTQIDHLLINRTNHFYLIETKNYNGNIAINEHGEFSVSYPGERTFGIPSPLEQSRRHENILRKVLERLEIGARVGNAPVFHHIVMIDPKGIIHRPDAKRFDTSMVIKADQFRTWHTGMIEKMGVGTVLVSMLNLRGADTLRELAEKLVRQHRPDDPLRLPESWRPRAPKTEPNAPVTFTAELPAPASASKLPAAAEEPASRKRLVCLTCHSKISYAEGRFCWSNERRFQGGQYCREHQAAF